MSGNRVKTQRIFEYIYNNKPALNISAIFADGTEGYRYPPEINEGEAVTLKLRTAINNVDNVYLICNGNRYNMYVEQSDELFDYYAYKLHEVTSELDYYYEIISGSVVCYYNKLSNFYRK